MNPETAERALLAAIGATPDDDTPRLVFADWLEENSGTMDFPREQAELIRLQCRLDPVWERFDDRVINAQRDRVQELLRPLREAEEEWLDEMAGPHHGITPCWRRGFVDTLLLPVQAFLREGERLRQRYPFLRKLVLFRLNGWGQRLAQCEWLRGIREIEFPCWYADSDARAVASSRHLSAVERVVCWCDDNLEQGRIFAQGTAWPGLRNLHLVARYDEHPTWVEAINEAAGRPIGSLQIVTKELFPLAADFDEECFLVGRLPDGTQLFLSCGVESTTAEGIAFDPDGTPRAERFRCKIPPQVAIVPQEEGEDQPTFQKRRLDVRNAYLRQKIGFIPAMIHVKSFDFYWTPARLSEDVSGRWGTLDPESGPHNALYPCGYGDLVYDWVTEGMYELLGGNNPWCDRSGHTIST